MVSVGNDRGCRVAKVRCQIVDNWPLNREAESQEQVEK